MPDIDYETLTLRELEQIQRDVAKAIESFHARQRSEAKAKVNALAKEYGFASAEQLVSLKSPRAKKPMVPVFRNPDDHNQVCGRQGRKPAWFQECLDKGYTQEDLMIQNQ